MPSLRHAFLHHMGLRPAGIKYYIFYSVSAWSKTSTKIEVVKFDFVLKLLHLGLEVEPSRYVQPRLVAAWGGTGSEHSKFAWLWRSDHPELGGNDYLMYDTNSHGLGASAGAGAGARLRGYFRSGALAGENDHVRAVTGSLKSGAQALRKYACGASAK
eukprot:6201682-Pleurochrysis_carterae.AAC.2